MANVEKDQPSKSSTEFSQKSGAQILYEARGFAGGRSHLRYSSSRLPLWDSGKYLNLPTTSKKAA